jgi:hypothetical protein
MRAPPDAPFEMRREPSSRQFTRSRSNVWSPPAAARKRMHRATAARHTYRRRCALRNMRRSTPQPLSARSRKKPMFPKRAKARVSDDTPVRGLDEKEYPASRQRRVQCRLRLGQPRHDSQSHLHAPGTRNRLSALSQRAEGITEWRARYHHKT